MTVIEDQSVARPPVTEDIEVLVIDETSPARASRPRAEEEERVAWLVSPGLGAATSVALPAGHAPVRIRMRYRASGESHIREWERHGVSSSGDAVYRLTGDSATSFPGLAVSRSGR